jgi:hypothetical protein
MGRYIYLYAEEFVFLGRVNCLTRLNICDRNAHHHISSFISLGYVTFCALTISFFFLICDNDKTLRLCLHTKLGTKLKL